jgi:hypothetical protein
MGGNNIYGALMTPGKQLYAIDSGLDAVVTKKLSDPTPAPTLYSYRVSAISVDEVNTLFALSSGNCHDYQALPSTGGEPTQQAQACNSPYITVVAQTPTGYVQTTAPFDSRLDVFYSFENSIYATNGKLYVIVVVSQPDGSWKQQILQYAYSVGKGSITVDPPIVFADLSMFSEWPFLTSLTSFSGGNVTNPIQQ